MRNWISEILPHANGNSVSTNEPAEIKDIGETTHANGNSICNNEPAGMIDETKKNSEGERPKELQNKIINHQLDAQEFSRNEKKLEVQEEIQA